MISKVSHTILFSLLLLSNIHISANKLIQEIKNNNLEQATKLVQEGINVNATDEFGKTPLHYAISCNIHLFAKRLATKSNLLKFIQLLIKRGADINAQDKFGLTPFHEGISDSHSTNYLLATYNIDKNQLTKSGKSILEFVTKHNPRLFSNSDFIKLYDLKASNKSQLIKNFVLENYKKFTSCEFKSLVQQTQLIVPSIASNLKGP